MATLQQNINPHTQTHSHNKRKIWQQFLVPMAWGIHPFPFRTRKLRPTAATILGPQGPGKIARRQIQYKTQKASESNLGGLCRLTKPEQRA